MTSITPSTRPPAKRDALRCAVRQLRFQRGIAATLLFLLAILVLFLVSVSVAHAQTTAPTVSTVAVTSDPGADDTYALGDTIEVGLTFSEAVTVTGTPYLLIDVGGTNRRADYSSGTGATQLKFQYTVLAGDDDDDGIAVVANSLTLNDGTIVATDDSAAATLDHAALTTTTHKVDIVVTLHSNLGQTRTGSITMSDGGTFHEINTLYETFTVGNNAAGYQITSIAVDVTAPSDTLKLSIILTDERTLAPGRVWYEFTGTVATAGTQIFTLNEDETGNLYPNWQYFVHFLASGTGSVQLGQNADYEVRFSVRGFPGAVPRLIHSAVSSAPFDGLTYHAGEHIEVELEFSYATQVLDQSFRVPLLITNGAERRVLAREVSKYDGITPHDGDTRLVYLYTVRASDVDSDGIVIDRTGLLGDDGRIVFANLDDANVPASTDLQLVRKPATSHAIDGSMKHGCAYVFCTTGNFYDAHGEVGHFVNNPGMANTYFQYGDEEYVILALYRTFHYEDGGDIVYMGWDRRLLPSQRVIDRLTLVVAGTELHLRDARVDYESDHVGFTWPDSQPLPTFTTEETIILLKQNVDISFGSSTYDVDEGGTVEVEVTLSADIGDDVTVPISVVNQDGATDDDYAAPESVTIMAGETSKKFVITPEDDDVDDDGESLQIEFGDLPGNLSPGETTETVVTIVDNDDPQVEVSFDQSAYDVAEGASQTVTVNLSADPERTVVIPLTATNQDGASSADYSVPASVTFDTGDTTKDITFAATDDSEDDDGESVKLTFGTLPDRVTAGAEDETVVSIDDDDAPTSVAVSWGEVSYTVAEGGMVTVTVELDDDPEKTVTVPIQATGQNGASGADYSGVPTSVTFNSGDTAKTFSFQAAQDTLDDDGESVQLSFGPTLPTGVTEGAPGTATVSITDDDLAGDRLASLVVAPKDIDGFDPEVTGYMVGVASTVSRATITATPAQPDSTVTIDGTKVTAGSAHAVDLSTGLNTFEVVVTSADNDQATYTVYVGRGTTGQGGWKAGDDLDTLRAAGNTEPGGIWSNGTTVWIADVSNAKLYAYSQADGARDGDKDIAVGGVIMAPTGIWSDGTTIWVIGPVDMTAFAYTLSSGARDSASDIDLGSDLMLPVDTWSDGVTMWVLDSHDDKLYAYTLSGGARDTDKDIDLAGENAAPLGVWSNGTTVWVTDRDDRKLYAYNFSGERVAGHDIDLHSRNADAGAIWGNDDTLWVVNDINDVSSPFNRVFTYNNVAVTVSFGQSSYTVAESDDTSTTEVAENAVEVKVTLSADPKRQVVVPITATNLGNATGADYSGVPANLTFESGETEKSFTFTATHDTRDDDGESVQLAFGTLPPGVSGGAYSEAVVSITDDDIGVSFERMGYETTEGDSVDVKVTLSSPATREVTIPLDADKQGGASDDDYTGVQDSITFRSSDTETSIRFTAVDDEVDDDGEKVRLRFGTLPTGLVPGANVEATITITDNDMPTDRLMSLVVAPKDIDGFDSEVTDYMVGVASTVTQATITATPYRSDDTVTIDGTTVIGGSDHTVDLSVGLNTFAVVVDSAATQEQTTYTVYIGRGTTDQGGWKAGDDLDTLRSPGNTSPTGAWSDATTTWIADSNDGKLYAYTLADGSRDSDKDITLDSNNSNPVGIWSDDTTIWVAELMPAERKVYAYTLADGSRDSDKDITLRGGNTSSWGVWSDGTTMWVVDWNDDELYAYTLADDSRDSDKDIALHGDNTSPRGIWSDGTTIWVVDSTGAKLYAYALSDGVRVGGYDIGLHSSNAGAGGIWANDDTAWVVNSATEDGSPFDRVFTYNNIPVRVSFGQSTYAVAEGSSVTVKVTLSADPKRQVVIPLTATGQDGASAADYSAPASVTFESGQTTRDVTFTATEDAVDDDDETVLLGLGATLPAGVIPGSPATSTVAITDDDDPQVEVSFDRSAYDVAEGGNVTITVNLSADPERTVEVPLTATRQGGASGADYSVPATVTFDSGETAKDITFAATQDAIDDDGEKVLLGFGASLPDRVSASTTTPRATVTILDDDVRGVTVSPASLTVVEGMTAEYTVVLDTEPTGNVTVTVNDPTDNTDVTAAPASLTFDENDWSTPQTVTVSAVQDADGVNDTATVTHTVGGADYASETASDVSVTVVDDETPDVTIAPTGITVLPGGSNEYTVVLDTEPTVQVTVTVTGHADTVLSVSPEQLTFDANDWDTPKTVEVSADDSVTTTETIRLAHGLAGGEYRSVTADDVAVTVVKASGVLDFQVGVTASPQALTVPEDKSRSYSVVLSAVPTGDVTVTVNLPTGNDLSIDKSSLTFTTDNWNVPQAVRVSAADDDDGIQDAPVTIGHTVSGGGYGSGDNFGITVTIEENDTPAVTLSTVSLVIAEGEEATYTVALDTQPSDDVTVVINDPTDNTDVTAAPASLTFTRSNWSAPQTVTVTTVTDHDTDTDTATITHTVSGGDYAAVTAKNVDVTVTDGCIVIWCGVLIMEKDPRFTRELRTVSLEDDDFEYKGTDYRIDRPKLYGGGPDPQEDYPLTVRIPERAWFKLDVRGPLHETEHYLDWTLYVNGVELPFSQAKRVRDDIPGNWGILFKWYGREFHELFPPGDLGTGATLYLSIKETPRDTQTPKAPGPPLHLTVETQNRDELWATWTRPQRRDDDDRNLYVDSYRVQWKEGSGDWETPADVTEATLTPMSARFFYTHVIKGLPPGVEYEVRVIATNAVGDSEPSNVATGMIEPDSSGQQSTELRSNSPATGGPGISGTPLVGETLTATTSGIQDEDGLTDADFAYQWVRSELGSNSETDIAGATGSSYAVTSDDAGKAIKVRVAFTDDAGNEESLTSFGVVAAPALPEAQVPDPPGRPDVSPHASGSLAVYWTGPASDGGSAVAGYRVQWKEAADSWDTAADVSEAAATGISHTITGLTDGTEYSVRVLAINDVGESLPSEDGTGTPRETVPPELSEASVDGTTLTLTFNEALDENSAPPTTAFTVTVSGNVRAVDSVNVTGGAVTLTLASAVASGDMVTVSYAVPARESAERLRDAAGNAAASFTGQGVTNDTSPTHAFTASIHDAPQSHDGQNAFTFELRLSEAPKQGFSYKTLRDHAFTVTGGEVLKARRLEKGKNVRWEIHVRPDSSGNVTIVLPITEDCDAQGAICTGDGRPLSNRLELTVSGPGG